jgi:hypothetical protein
VLPMTTELHGAEAVLRQARKFASRADLVQHRALVNGAPGTVTVRHGEVFSVGGFTVRNGRIVAIDFLADPERLKALDLTILGT